MLRWIRLSCRAFHHNAVRLQLFALAYNPQDRGEQGARHRRLGQLEDHVTASF